MLGCSLVNHYHILQQVWYTKFKNKKQKTKIKTKMKKKFQQAADCAA